MKNGVIHMVKLIVLLFIVGFVGVSAERLYLWSRQALKRFGQLRKCYEYSSLLHTPGASLLTKQSP